MRYSLLSAYVACDSYSLAVIEQPVFKGLIPTKTENGFTLPVGGTKSDLDLRWTSDKPVTLDGVTLTCSIQGNVVEPMLVDSRPDLIKRAQ